MRQFHSILENVKNKRRIQAVSGLILLLWLLINAQHYHFSSHVRDVNEWKILWVFTVLYFSQAILVKKWIHRIIQGMYGFCILYVLYNITNVMQIGEVTFQEEFGLYRKVFLKICVLVLLLWFSGKLKPEFSNKKPFN
jgi:hypothetical protein